MDVALIVARLIHIGAGVFWAGTMLFSARFLIPAMEDAGPPSGAVMTALGKRGYATAIPVAAVLTILAGIYLLYRASAGFNNVYMSSGSGITYSIGGTAAIIALAIGATMVRGAMTKVLDLLESAASRPESERGAIVAEIAAHRGRGARGTRIVALLLTITVICMAIGRYV